MEEKTRIPFIHRGWVKILSMVLLLAFGAMTVMGAAGALIAYDWGMFSGSYLESRSCTLICGQMSDLAVEYHEGGMQDSESARRSLSNEETNYRYIIYADENFEQPVATNFSAYARAGGKVELRQKNVDYIGGELLEGARYVGWTSMTVTTGQTTQTQVIPADQVLHEEYRNLLEGEGWVYSYEDQGLYLNNYEYIPLEVREGVFYSRDYDQWYYSPSNFMEQFANGQFWTYQVNYEQGERAFATTQTLNEETGELTLSWTEPKYDSFFVEQFVDMDFSANDELAREYNAWQQLYWLPSTSLVFLGVGLAGCLVFLILCLYGCGRKAGVEEICLNPLDRIPLDLYAGILGAGVAGLITVTISIFPGYYSFSSQEYWICVGVGTGAIYLACVLVLAFILSFATRLKKGEPFKNTLCGWMVRGVWKALRWCGKVLVQAVGALPLAWRWGLGVCVLLVAQVLLSWNIIWNGGVPFLLLFLLDGAIVVATFLVASQLAKLEAAGQALARGEILPPMDTAGMIPALARHAQNLGEIGQGMERAVAQRLKSERMKTELITNVSHDIKTPLTSIINYIDLLEKEPLEDKAAEYCQVLSRQAARLKKLTEDVVEASKASTGNMEVHLDRVELRELLEQAVGEYQERMEAAGLTVVLDAPEALAVQADGRLTWRIIDNLLGNACKYALPGTRVYVMAEQADGKGRLIVKNISRDPLNISADELMERFVRGDTSRSTEGSGLGLNIAKSLAALQGGNLLLTVDGDLFKAQVILPLAE